MIHVVPTPVGVNRSSKRKARHNYRCPHARGGEPAKGPHPIMEQERCPHARGGEPVWIRSRQSASYVVPTPVGVNRIFVEDNSQLLSLSPRPWG